MCQTIMMMKMMSRHWFYDKSNGCDSMHTARRVEFSNSWHVRTEKKEIERASTSTHPRGLLAVPIPIQRRDPCSCWRSLPNLARRRIPKKIIDEDFHQFKLPRRSSWHQPQHIFWYHNNNDNEVHNQMCRDGATMAKTLDLLWELDGGRCKSLGIPCLNR